MRDRRRLRDFGLLVGGILTVIGLYPLILSNGEPRIWALAAAVLLGVPAVVKPSLLQPFYRVWMFAGHLLGWVNTRIILAVLYYLMFMPVGFLMRRFSGDPLRRKRDPEADTYRVVRGPRPASHMKRQF